MGNNNVSRGFACKAPQTNSCYNTYASYRVAATLMTEVMTLCSSIAGKSVPSAARGRTKTSTTSKPQLHD